MRRWWVVLSVGEEIVSKSREFWAGGFDWVVEHRFVLSAIADCCIVAAAVVAACLLRFEFDVASIAWSRAAIFVVFAATAHLLLANLGYLYSGVARFGSFDELATLSKVVAGSSALSMLMNGALEDRLLPTSVSMGYGVGALAGMAGMRYLWRLELDRRRRPDENRATKVVVYGAGEGGYQVILAMLRNPMSSYFPAALIDDAPGKAQMRISGVRVRGTLDDLSDVARRAGAKALVIAIPSADAELVRRADAAARACDLEVLILPAVDNLLEGSVGLEDIRPVTEEDLLGRVRVDTDIDAIAGYLTGKRVLVTGAGGSIGSELCRQIRRFAPSRLVMLDRDESLLHAVQMSIDGRGQLDSRELVVADIRDRQRMQEVFAEWMPEVVFHAAALKHVPLLEMHPEEGRKTNVLGTQHLLDCADACDVERFVNISTDKAADPVNVLGRTKREAEQRTAATGSKASGTYISVRFGNVLGSRGSVLTAFREQIARGGPVTVTHPDVTRYFMTVSEAVQLVIQAGAIGGDGEVLILAMGAPVKIADVARRMVEAADRPVEIVYTGLRPGEKMHEILQAENETGRAGPHHLITHVEVAAPQFQRSREVAPAGTR